MRGYIDGISFTELPAEKYWSFPKTYKGDAKAETKNFILSGIFSGSLKQDGHYCRLIKDEDGNIRMQGRSKSVNGEYLDKHEWVPQLKSLFDWLPNGTCLLGELYFPNQRGSRKVTTILGCLMDKAIIRQEKGEKLSYYIFDVWSYNGKSFLNTTAEKRFEFIGELEKRFKEERTNPYVEFAKYLKGEELWNLLGETLSSGGEGIVITRNDSKPEPGKRTARKTLKVKMEIEQTIDAFLDGGYKLPTRLYNGKEIKNWQYYENIKTGEKENKNMYFEYSMGMPWEPVTKNYFYERAAAVSISVMKNGKPFHIGYISGIPDEMREGIVRHPEKYINKVYEITCMEIEKIDENYSLRHAKFIQERPEKNYIDCDFSQISGE